ncbi:ABC transporter ATP-binding protein [Oscillospiraceae bacterium MB08-C2-2]|nr:ABC transporter ATP-binding protein [Oscillospiraceae bacterium MB08-C2-2]
MENIISVKGLKKSYGNKIAVDGITFTVEKGSIFGLLGHNGAGKSTTIECILGTRLFEEGEIRVLSQNPLTNRKQLFQRVGVQFQNAAYQYKIKVREICEINHSLYKNSADWRVMLAEFGLADKMNSFVSDLSGGEQQKLYIILAVMHNPALVFFDELTTGLDPKARRTVWKYIHGLKAKGTTIFLTSHYMDEVENLCDKVVILKQGRILMSGTVNQVLAQSGKSNMDEAFLYFAEEEEAI